MGTTCAYTSISGMAPEDAGRVMAFFDGPSCISVRAGKLRLKGVTACTGRGQWQLMAAADQLQGPWPFGTPRRAERDECDPGGRRVRTLVQDRRASLAEQLSLSRLPARRRLSCLELYLVLACLAAWSLSQRLDPSAGCSRRKGALQERPAGAVLGFAPAPLASAEVLGTELSVLQPSEPGGLWCERALGM